MTLVMNTSGGLVLIMERGSGETYDIAISQRARSCPPLSQDEPRVDGAKAGPQISILEGKERKNSEVVVYYSSHS